MISGASKHQPQSNSWTSALPLVPGSLRAAGLCCLLFTASCLSHLWSCSVFTVKAVHSSAIYFVRICWGSKVPQAEDKSRGKTACGCYTCLLLASGRLLKTGWQLICTEKIAVAVRRQNLEASETLFCSCFSEISRCLYDDDAAIEDFTSSILSGMSFYGCTKFLNKDGVTASAASPQHFTFTVSHVCVLAMVDKMI